MQVQDNRHSHQFGDECAKYQEIGQVMYLDDVILVFEMQSGNSYRSREKEADVIKEFPSQPPLFGTQKWEMVFLTKNLDTFIAGLQVNHRAIANK